MSHVLSSKGVVIAAAAILAIVVALLFVGRTGGARADEGASVVLRNASGARVGEAKLTQEGGKVLVRAVVHHLAPGFHGFHVHAVGDCTVGDPTNPFLAAGGHLGAEPGTVDHPAHHGDMPVLLVNANGTGQARFETDRFTLADVAGRALIIHASPDNYANIPSSRYASTTGSPTVPDQLTKNTGDAGSRVACGMI